MRALLSALIAIFAFPSVVRAGDLCRDGLWAEDQQTFTYGLVRASEPLSFLSDRGDCPSTDLACVTRGTVMPGESLVVGHRHGEYACVYIPEARGGIGSAGWLPSAQIDIVKGADPKPIAWAGRWSDGINEVWIRVDRNGVLRAHGQAYWPSRHISRSLVPAGVHKGGFSGLSSPDGGHVRFQSHDGCEVEFWLAGPFLVGRDNQICGAANATFTQVYRRAGR